MLKVNSTYHYSYTFTIYISHLSISDYRLMIFITIDIGSNNTVVGSCYSADKALCIFFKLSSLWKLSLWHVFECSCILGICGAGRKVKKLVCGISRPNLCQMQLFHLHFLLFMGFWEISMIIIVICGLSKSATLSHLRFFLIFFYKLHA